MHLLKSALGLGLYGKLFPVVNSGSVGSLTTTFTLLPHPLGAWSVRLAVVSHVHHSRLFLRLHCSGAGFNLQLAMLTCMVHSLGTLLRSIIHGTSLPLLQLPSWISTSLSTMEIGVPKSTICIVPGMEVLF